MSRCRGHLWTEVATDEEDVLVSYSLAGGEVMSRLQATGTLTERQAWSKAGVRQPGSGRRTLSARMRPALSLGSAWPLTSGFGVAAWEAGCPLRRGAPISADFEDRFTLNFGRKSVYGGP